MDGNYFFYKYKLIEIKRKQQLYKLSFDDRIELMND